MSDGSSQAYRDSHPLPSSSSVNVGNVAEVRVVDPNTGGEKCSKPVRFDLLPAHPLWQVALLYGSALKKYEPNNWRKGYKWSLSVAALFRHLFLWLQGERFDTEVSEMAGEPVSHLACVVWHCFTLMEFQQYNRGTNDLYEHARLHHEKEYATPVTDAS